MFSIKKIKCAVFLSTCIILLAFFSAPVIGRESVPQQPDISAHSAVLMLMDSGEVIFEKAVDERRAMASTTKILTALITLEDIEENGDRVIEITEEMAMVEGSSMGLEIGDHILLSELAVGMMLPSGNDAANSAAIAISGSFEAFAQKMNERTHQIGMTDSSFVTPSGLDDENHYTTAYDMGLLTVEALKNKAFLDIASSDGRRVSFENSDKEIKYQNHNRLLREYEGCIGVKTGFTKKAGRCLVSAAERDGVGMIVVTLDAPDDWDDHRKLLDYGFSLYKRELFNESTFETRVNTVGSQRDSIKVRSVDAEGLVMLKNTAEKIERVVCIPHFLYAPVKEGDKVGEIRYKVDGNSFFSAPIYAAEDAEIIKEEKSGLLKRLWSKK